MTTATYKPYFLEAITALSGDRFVLDIRPLHFADMEDYHEIHITAPQVTFDAMKHHIGQYIYIDLVSPTTLDLYQGEFYEESSSDGPLPYSHFAIKRLEKTGRAKWKPLYHQLLQTFKKLFAQKIILYETTRNKVVANYKVIYDKQVATKNLMGLTQADLDKGHTFHHLYSLFDNNPAWDGLSDLIDWGYLTAPTPKDWGLAYTSLQKVYKNLQNVDVNDYATIRNHIIARYTRTFKHLLANLPYNYPDIDTAKYKGFFQLLMDRLGDTMA